MITQIELAILARLKAAEPALGYEWGSRETYPDDDFDGYLEALKVLKPPVAWVAFGGMPRMEQIGGGASKATGVFVLVVGAQNNRNEQAQRHGAAGKVGAYQLALDAVALLNDSDLGLDISPLRATAVRGITPTPAIRKRKLSLYAVVLETDFAVEPVAAELGDFDVFHANWDVPPFGGVDADPDQEGVQLPADDQADLTDHHQLPQEP